MRPRGSRYSNFVQPRPRRQGSPRSRRRRRIGLLGGSFNPAHEGHLAISLEALKRLRLDQVWWLVAPQNPLKDRADTAPYDERLARARQMADHPRVVVTDVEAHWGCRYTIDTVRLLQARAADIAFVWLMGADAFATLHDWRRWTDLAERIPIAVLNRPGFIHEASSSKAAIRYSRLRRPQGAIAGMASARAPDWSFIDIPLRHESSTALRLQKESLK